MKWKQYIRVQGTPDIIMETLKGAPLNVSYITPAGHTFYLTCVTDPVRKEIHSYLVEAGFKVVVPATANSIMKRPRYLLLSRYGISGAVRGHVKGGDIIYTVESDDELILLQTVKACTEELQSMGVKYDEVCRWSCDRSATVPVRKRAPKKR